MLRRLFSTHPQLTATLRPITKAGSRKSRQLRKENKLPGVVYGVDDDRNVLKVMVTVDLPVVESELRRLGQKFENTIYEMTIQDEEKQAEPQKHFVVPRQTQLCGLTRKPLAVNYLRYIPGTRLQIPIEFINQELSADLKRGSFIYRVNHYVECVCDEEIPQTILCDVSSAMQGSVFRLQNLQFPPKVRPSKAVPPDYVVCVVQSPKG